MSLPNALAGWRDEFEELLDEGLAVVRPDWRPPEAPDRVAAAPQHALAWRCNQKRMALAAALKDAPELVRAHRSLLLRLIVHDLNSSFNQYLIGPVANSIGLSEVHKAIIGFTENGTLTERFGAVRAWYSAQPGLHYDTVRDYRQGDPSQASSLHYAEWLALWPRYKEAGRHAVESCTDPEARTKLAEEISAFTELRQIGKD